MSAKIRRYSARLSRIIVLLFNKLITKLVTFLNLSVDIFSLHFFFPRTKLRISSDICYPRMTDIESIMTIFGYGCAMLMSPKQDETAVHGCHSTGTLLCACVKVRPDRGDV